MKRGPDIHLIAGHDPEFAAVPVLQGTDGVDCGGEGILPCHRAILPQYPESAVCTANAESGLARCQRAGVCRELTGFGILQFRHVEFGRWLESDGTARRSGKQDRFF